ncbi:FAD/NAD(P)-binding domain-containing protein [Ramaria rubella]|nr:FAD/NAD(P)-binding domain-containing protein [Ramaria rubella]
MGVHLLKWSFSQYWRLILSPGVRMGMNRTLIKTPLPSPFSHKQASIPHKEFCLLHVGEFAGVVLFANNPGQVQGQRTQTCIPYRIVSRQLGSYQPVTHTSFEITSMYFTAVPGPVGRDGDSIGKLWKHCHISSHVLELYLCRLERCSNSLHRPMPRNRESTLLNNAPSHPVTSAIPWSMAYDYDCIVLGTGNAALCAAITAAESGCSAARVLVLDKAPEEWAGGNSYFTAGAFRTAHGGLRDLVSIVHSEDDARLARTDIEPYPGTQFIEDILRLGESKSDRALVDAVVGDSRDAVQWLAEDVGVRFTFPAHRQAYEVDGRIKFWGGLVLAARDGGKGLVQDLMTKARGLSIEFRWETEVVGLVVEEDTRVRGVKAVDARGEERTLTARAVILACGGFEANQEMRAKYLGSDWDYAHVRGTPYNQGDGFKLALALPLALRPNLVGDWAGCHSTCWDFNSPKDGGSRDVTNAYTKSGYPLGLMINPQGRRYVDEGADFRNYTYAIYGRATLAQPGGFAFQVWDKKGKAMLRVEEYGDGVTRMIEAASVEELAQLLTDEGLEDPEAFVETVKEYNDAVKAFKAEFQGVTFDPAVKDGLSTQSSTKTLAVPKSNWARTIAEAPFVAVKITCGVTFTFGGLPIDPGTAGVVGAEGTTVDGLFCAGEIVGNLFWRNYPGGSGLTSGAVFGRRAGREAGRLVSEGKP